MRVFPLLRVCFCRSNDLLRAWGTLLGLSTAATAAVTSKKEATIVEAILTDSAAKLLTVLLRVGLNEFLVSKIVESIGGGSLMDVLGHDLQEE